MLAFTFVFFLQRKVLKSLQTPNESILLWMVLLEIASYSVMLLGDSVKLWSQFLKSFCEGVKNQS